MPIVKKNADFVSKRKADTVSGQVEALKNDLSRQKTERLSREEFDLLNTTYADTIYYITETDGSVSIREGEF